MYKRLIFPRHLLTVHRVVKKKKKSLKVATLPPKIIFYLHDLGWLLCWVAKSATCSSNYAITTNFKPLQQPCDCVQFRITYYVIIILMFTSTTCPTNALPYSIWLFDKCTAKSRCPPERYYFENNITNSLWYVYNKCIFTHS